MLPFSPIHVDLCRHGDLLYVIDSPSWEAAPEPTPSQSTIVEDAKVSIAPVAVDAVDEYLEKQDGLIKRGRDTKL